MSLVTRQRRKETFEPVPAVACDGDCGTEVELPAGEEPPDGWLMVRETGRPKPGVLPRHFCPRCRLLINFPGVKP